MRRNAVFGVVVHFVGADLHLQRLSVGADHRRVQRLVYAEAWRGNIVLKPSRHRLVNRVDRTDSGIAILHVIDQNAHTHQVEDLVKVAPAHNHLLVDRPVVLGSAFHRGVQRAAGHGQLDLLLDLGQVLVALRGTVGHQPHDLFVLLGIQDRKGQILEFPLDRCHAQAVRQRGNNF